MAANGQEENRKLSSYAWLQRRGPLGIPVYDAGMLLAAGDRVSFVTAKGPVFEADRNEIKVRWPRLWLGAGIYLTVGDKLHRISLDRPKGAETFDEAKESLPKATFDILTDSDLKDLILGARDFHRGRASGKAWKAYFGAETGATASEEHETAPEEQE
jgi:hypothetical protein